MIRSKLNRLRAGIVLTAALGLVLSACGSSTDDSKSSDGKLVKLTVAPTSASVVAYAEMWLAGPLGYYKQQGLDVKVIGNVPGGSVENALQLGRLDFGGSSQQNLIPLDGHSDRSVKLFATTGNFNFAVMVLDDSPIKTASDLVGKKIGITGPGGDEHETHTLMTAAGVKNDQYKTVVTGGRAPAAQQMKSGKLDAFEGSITSDKPAMEAAGYKVRIIPTGDVTSFYNSGWAASEKTLKDRRDVAVKFGRALAESQIWMYENPVAAIDVLAKVQPAGVGDKKAAVAQLKLVTGINRSRFDARYKADPAVWQKAIDLMAQSAAIPAKYDANKVFTNDLLDDIWNFDVAGVEADAKAGTIPK